MSLKWPAVRDSLAAVKNQVKEEVKQEVKNQIAKQIFGQKDTTATKDSANRNVKQEAVDKGKSIIKGLFKKN